MVKVASSRGGVVNVEVTGVAEVVRFIRSTNQDIKFGADTGTLQAANFAQQEVQESIIGNRPEPKSVDTGRFANSIFTNKIDDGVYKVFPRRVNYPNSNLTTQDIANFMEFGTRLTFPRRHFQNTKDRTKDKVRKIIDQAIKRKLRLGI